MESLNRLSSRLGEALILLVLCGCRGTPESVEPTEPVVAVTARRTSPAAGSGASASASRERSGLAAPPQAIVLPGLARGNAPDYPEMSRRLGEEGTVELRLGVRSDGVVVSLEVAASSGYRRLDDAALTAARTWQFNPRTGPYGVEVLHHRLVFRLEDDG